MMILVQQHSVKIKDMGKRLNRKVSETTRRKISLSLKDYYRNRRSQSAKEHKSKIQSIKMKEYWKSIPIE